MMQHSANKDARHARSLRSYPLRLSPNGCMASALDVITEAPSPSRMSLVPAFPWYFVPAFYPFVCASFRSFCLCRSTSRADGMPGTVAKACRCRMIPPSHRCIITSNTNCQSVVPKWPSLALHVKKCSRTSDCNVSIPRFLEYR